jgi:hypothetical protein
MDRQGDPETLQILRGLLLLRLALLAPFFVAIVVAAACKPNVGVGLVLLLLILAAAPFPLYVFRRDLLVHPRVPQALVLFDFLFASLMSYIAAGSGGLPIFFPLYFLLVALEAACWWGWAGSLISGAAGSVVLALLYMDPSSRLADNQGWGMLALVMGWPVVLGYFTQWALRQWRERRRMTTWLTEQEGVVGQVRERLSGWQAACAALQQVTTVQELAKTVLREALTNTGSTLGLVALRDPRSGALRAECWTGFALPGADSTTLQLGDRLPAPQGGGVVEVRYVQEISLPTATLSAVDGRTLELGRIVVARQSGRPYQEGEGHWLQIMASHAAVLLENRFLRGQLGRVQEEAGSIAAAGLTLASLPDPAAAMELACRNVLDALHLQRVVIFLYSGEMERGCTVIVYSAQEPARTATLSLQGKGLRLLRRFLDGGTSVVINRRGEWPELFDLMGWSGEVQAAACFPLYVLEHRWGALCLLAELPDAFPSQTQENLTIFSGEVSMALENFYLRQSAGATRA